MSTNDSPTETNASTDLNHQPTTTDAAPIPPTSAPSSQPATQPPAERIAEIREADQRAVVTLEEWTRTYNLHPAFLPFDHRKQDPIEGLLELRAHLEGLRPTAATWRYPDIDTGFNFGAFCFRDELALACRAFPYERFTSSGQQYANPNYVHLKVSDPTITDPEDRIAVLRTCAAYGLFRLHEIAPYFGCEPEYLREITSKDERIDWQAWRYDGLERFGRTVRTILEWSDYSQRDLAYAFDLPRSTLVSYLPRNLIGTPFDPPEDPADETWFDAAHRYRTGQTDHSPTPDDTDTDTTTTTE